MSDENSLEGVTERRSYNDSDYYSSIGLVNEANKVTPGQELDALTDDELDALIGIDSDGNVKPEVLASALRDALMTNPIIYALMTAEQIDDEMISDG